MSVRLTLTLAHAHAQKMADLDDMLREFAHFHEQAERAEPPESSGTFAKVLRNLRCCCVKERKESCAETKRKSGKG